MSVEFKKRATPAVIPLPDKEPEIVLTEIPSPPAKMEEEIIEPIIEKAPVEPVVEEEIAEPPVAEAQEEKVIPEPIIEKAPVEPIVEEEIAEPVAEEVPEEETYTEEPYYGDKQGPTSRRSDTNTLTVIITTAVVGIVLVIISGRFFVQYVSNSFNQEETNTAQVSGLLTTSTLEYISLNQENVNRLPSLIIEREPNSQSDITEFVITSQTGTIITPSNIFNTLGFNVIPALHRSLTGVRFLNTSETNNLILIKFVDETTVQGGLLYWEENLARDLTELFSLPAESGNKFSDMTISGVDVRVLRSDEEIILLYGIIDENTALITTDENSFAQIVELEFKN